MKLLIASQQIGGGDSSNGSIQDFDHVEGGKGPLAAAAEATHQLQKAAGICRDDSRRVGCEQMRDFSVAKLLRWFGLQQVVDSGRTTTERGLCDLCDFEAGDAGEEFARLLINALCVTKMAGIVVSDA